MSIPSISTSIKVQLEDFDFALEVDNLEANNSTDGAVVTFIGRVRDNNDGLKVEHLFLEHYSGMTEKCLADIVEQARAQWQIGNVCVIHRYGQLNIGDKIVFVGVTSKHRKDAFSAAEFIMDYLKVSAPFWKKEQTEQGERWVAAKQNDQLEANKW
ncbi:molybdopterin synthase catalytic subunit MoaE [Thalassomonas sp. M1454]|uniref:molybdopterin synthase catalytic subunit MoaE n=1 Tax=Thalassomonas sp. M1454 TaxID=2594477 RepID=UPI0011817192|nr:molybdopterin synthase catalytic subunit MoaE [Thalassomonas sp. M1454]TRX53820.1 molybdopterin synthase catalytic subunit MoaE [Thalassomonas sp. M1454]